MMIPMNGGTWVAIAVTAIGYCCAVLIATMVTIPVHLLAVSPTGTGVWAWFRMSLQDMVGLVLAALVTTFVTALPLFLLSIWQVRVVDRLDGRRSGIRRLGFFAASGAVNAFAAVLVLDAVLFLFFAAPWMLLLTSSFAFHCVPGGIAGGFVYGLMDARLGTAKMAGAS